MNLRHSILAFALLAGCVAARNEVGSEKEPSKVLPFIEDDYPRALAVARERKLPLFVDSWAPW